MIYVGIDPGRRTGWAVLDEDGGRIGSGCWDAPGYDWASVWSTALGRTLHDVCGYQAYRMAFEHVTFHKGKAWAEIYYGQKALLAAHVWPLAVDLVTPAQVKATGGSRAKIGLMSNALEHFGLGEDYPIDDNEADALWIAEWVRRNDAR